MKEHEVSFFNQGLPVADDDIACVNFHPPVLHLGLHGGRENVVGATVLQLDLDANGILTRGGEELNGDYLGRLFGRGGLKNSNEGMRPSVAL